MCPRRKKFFSVHGERLPRRGGGPGEKFSPSRRRALLYIGWGRAAPPACMISRHRLEENFSGEPAQGAQQRLGEARRGTARHRVVGGAPTPCAGSPEKFSSDRRRETQHAVAEDHHQPACRRARRRLGENFSPGPPPRRQALAMDREKLFSLRTHSGTMTIPGTGSTEKLWDAEIARDDGAPSSFL